MAKASVLIKCQECGNTFTWSKKDCKNRDEANRAEEWARTGGVIYCPDCMRKFKAEQYKKKKRGKESTDHGADIRLYANPAGRL